MWRLIRIPTCHACVTFVSHLCNIYVTLVSHLCYTCVTFVSHLCHTCVTFMSHLCNICVTLVSHWLATLSHIGLPCFTSGWSGLSLVVATSLGCLWPFWSFRSNLDPFCLTLILSVRFWSFWSNFDPFGQILITSPQLKWSVLPGEILTSTETNLRGGI